MGNKRVLLVFKLFIFLSILKLSTSLVYGQRKNLLGDTSTFTSLHFGPVYKFAKGANTIDSTVLVDSYTIPFIPISRSAITQPYSITILGFQGSIQNSFILGYFIPQKGKRFRFGDTFLGSLSLGEQSGNIPGANLRIWGAYRFEIGGLGEYSASPNSKIIARWNVLVYEKDIISPYISGSSFELEAYMKPIGFGATILSRDSRILGFISALTQPSVNPHDFEFKASYRFKKNKEILLKSRWYNPGSHTLVDAYPNQNLFQTYSFQISYGYLF